MVFLAAFVLMALAPSALVLALGLFLYGFGFGATDVAMNAQGVTVERRLGRPIMGSLHGFFSLGALIGAAISAVLAAAGIGLEVNLLAFAALGLLILVWANQGQVKDEPHPVEHASGTKKARFQLPPRALWPLGVIAFCGAVGEGAMADWGALYIVDELGRSEGIAAFGFTVFSTTMLVGRFATDWMVARVGRARLLQVGSIVATIGLAGGLLLGTTGAAIAGYAVMGIGLAGVFPVVYSMAGSMPGIPSGRGVAAVATIGYTGFLAGPPLLGIPGPGHLDPGLAHRGCAPDRDDRLLHVIAPPTRRRPHPRRQRGRPCLIPHVDDVLTASLDTGDIDLGSAHRALRFSKMVCPLQGAQA